MLQGLSLRLQTILSFSEASLTKLEEIAELHSKSNPDQKIIQLVVSY